MYDDKNIIKYYKNQVIVKKRYWLKDITLYIFIINKMNKKKEMIEDLAHALEIEKNDYDKISKSYSTFNYFAQNLWDNLQFSYNLEQIKGYRGGQRKDIIFIGAILENIMNGLITWDIVYDKMIASNLVHINDESQIGYVNKKCSFHCSEPQNVQLLL